MVRGRPTDLLQSVGGFSAASMTTVVIFLRGRASQVSKEPQAEGLHPIGDWQAPGDTPDCLVGSVPGMELAKFSADTRCQRHRDAFLES